MPLSAVKIVSCFNTSGRGGGGVNYLAEVPTWVSQSLLDYTGSDRLNKIQFQIQPGMYTSLYNQSEPEEAVTSYVTLCVCFCVQADLEGSEMEWVGMRRSLYAYTNMFEYGEIWKWWFFKTCSIPFFFLLIPSLFSFFVFQGYHLSPEFVFLENTHTHTDRHEHTHLYTAYLQMKIDDRRLPNTLLHSLSCILSALYVFLSSPNESECFHYSSTSSCCQLDQWGQSHVGLQLWNFLKQLVVYLFIHFFISLSNFSSVRKKVLRVRTFVICVYHVPLPEWQHLILAMLQSQK